MSNFYLPPEWYEQDAVMLTWPHQMTDWAWILNQVEPVFVEIALEIARRQRLVIVVNNLDTRKRVQQQLAFNRVDLLKVQFVLAPTNDTWARDHGPITLIDAIDQVKALDFTFNGWGEKYLAKFDNQINLAVFSQLGVHNNASFDFVLEGGAIEINEDGDLLTTSACLLNANRNPTESAKDIEQKLCQWLGAKRVLWLEHGHLEGDDTDSHIDTLARFAPNKVIVYQGCQDTKDSHYQELQAMKKALQSLSQQDGQPFRLFELPWPDAQFNNDNQRLPATYANFLIINSAVLLPVYGVTQDEQAIDVCQKAFPEHDIVAVNSRLIIEQFGSLHCLTMQLPKGFLDLESVL